MQVARRAVSGGVVLRPEGDLVIRTAKQALGLLQKGANGAQAVTLDLSRVGLIDTAGIQLLLHFCVFFRANGIACTLTSLSPVVQGAFGRMGITDLLAEMHIECTGVQA